MVKKNKIKTSEPLIKKDRDFQLRFCLVFFEGLTFLGRKMVL